MCMKALPVSLTSKKSRHVKGPQTQFTFHQMPPDNVGSQLDLYNTKYTQLHLNMYKYPKGCIFFTYHTAYGKKVAKLLDASRGWPPRLSSLKLKSMYFTPTLLHSPLPISQDQN